MIPPNAHPRWPGPARLASTFFAAVVAFSCNPKDGQVFAPLVADDAQFPDVTPPSLRSYINPLNAPINDNRFAFYAQDIPGPTGQRISGMLAASIKAARENGPFLPVTPSSRADVFEVDVSAEPKTTNTLRIEGSDVAGNTASESFTFALATPATVTFDFPATISSALPNATINVAGRISTPHSLSASTIYVRQPSANGQCAPTAPLIGVGTTAGTVSQNTFPIATGAQFTFPVVFNGPTAQLPQTSDACVHFAAAYNAVNRFGESAPVGTDELYKLTFKWEVMPPSPGTISGRVTLNTTAPLPGITVTSGLVSTTTDANGNYTLNPVDPGTRTVSLGGVPPNVQCNPSSRTVDVVAGQTTTADFNCTSTNFQVTVEVVWFHAAPGVSFACARIRVTEIVGPFVGATWSASWVGPGLVGAIQRSGTFDATNETLDRQQINRFGTYVATVSVTANGVTKQASGEGTVGAPQGTCPPPPP